MRKVVLAIVAALSALLAVPAVAADGTLSAATPTYAWEGGPMNGVGNENIPATPVVGFAVARCSAAYNCDNEHIELKEAGSLVVDIKAGEGSTDLDVRLYASDAEGTAPGAPTPAGEAPQPIAEDIRAEKDARVTVKNLKPGFYVIQTASYTAQQGMYNGTASFTPSAGAAAPAAPAPGAAPAPSGAPAPQQTSPTPAQNQASEAKRKKKLAACNKKAKKIKNAKKRKAAQKKCAKKYGAKKP